MTRPWFAETPPLPPWQDLPATSERARHRVRCAEAVRFDAVSQRGVIAGEDGKRAADRLGGSSSSTLSHRPRLTAMTAAGLDFLLLLPFYSLSFFSLYVYIVRSFPFLSSPPFSMSRRPFTLSDLGRVERRLIEARHGVPYDGRPARSGTPPKKKKTKKKKKKTKQPPREIIEICRDGLAPRARPTKARTIMPLEGRDRPGPSRLKLSITRRPPGARFPIALRPLIAPEERGPRRTSCRGMDADLYLPERPRSVGRAVAEGAAPSEILAPSARWTMTRRPPGIGDGSDVTPMREPGAAQMRPVHRAGCGARGPILQLLRPAQGLPPFFPFCFSFVFLGLRGRGQDIQDA